jgi:hypothetical protein
MSEVVWYAYSLVRRFLHAWCTVVLLGASTRSCLPNSSHHRARWCLCGPVDFGPASDRSWALVNNSFLLELELGYLVFVSQIKRRVGLDSRFDLEPIIRHWSKAVTDFVFFTGCRTTKGLRLHNGMMGLESLKAEYRRQEKEWTPAEITNRVSSSAQVLDFPAHLCLSRTDVRYGSVGHST